MIEPIEQYPEPTLEDKARQGLRVGVAAVPVVGGSVNELMDLVIAPSLERRRDTWFRKLRELVAELQARPDFDLQNLTADDVFVTAVVEASRIAAGAHIDAKLDLLQNCLSTLAVTPDRDDFLAMQFIRYVDELEVEHFLVLEYLRNPSAWYDAKRIERPTLMSGSRSTILQRAGLPIEGAALDIAIRDLSDRGLIRAEMLNGQVSGGGLWSDIASPLGTSLLRFVKII